MNKETNVTVNREYKSTVYVYEYEMKLEDAVERAVTECIKENILLYIICIKIVRFLWKLLFKAFLCLKRNFLK